MDQGLIYESGSPEQIFDAPKGELTRKFINQIREYCYEIHSENYDFYGMMAGVCNFCVRYNMSSSDIDHITHIIEEGLLVMGAAKGTVVRVSYSEKDGGKDVSIKVPGIVDESVLESDEHSLQSAILRGVCRKVAMIRDEEGSTLRCLLD